MRGGAVLQYLSYYLGVFMNTLKKIIPVAAWLLSLVAIITYGLAGNSDASTAYLFASAGWSAVVWPIFKSIEEV